MQNTLWFGTGTLRNHHLSSATKPLVLEAGNHLLPPAEPAIILPSSLKGLYLLLCWLCQVTSLPTL